MRRTLVTPTACVRTGSLTSQTPRMAVPLASFRHQHRFSRVHCRADRVRQAAARWLQAALAIHRRAEATNDRQGPVHPHPRRAELPRPDDGRPRHVRRALPPSRLEQRCASGCQGSKRLRTRRDHDSQPSWRPGLTSTRAPLTEPRTRRARQSSCWPPRGSARDRGDHCRLGLQAPAPALVVA